MSIEGKMKELEHEKYELLNHIDTCFNFVRANPERADFYIDEGKKDILKIIEIEIELVGLQSLEIQGKLEDIGVRV